MRYGNPSIKEKMNKCKHGCQNMIILPLYPQYVAATTVSGMKLLEANENEMATKSKIIPH